MQYNRWTLMAQITPDGLKVLAGSMNLCKKPTPQAIGPPRSGAAFANLLRSAL